MNSHWLLSTTLSRLPESSNEDVAAGLISEQCSGTSPEGGDFLDGAVRLSDLERRLNATAGHFGRQDRRGAYSKVEF